jgi:hypothetical protein
MGWRPDSDTATSDERGAGLRQSLARCRKSPPTGVCSP